MAHSLTSGMLAVTQAAVCMPVAFVEVDTPGGNVYFWTGYGEISWNSQTWTGAGNLLGISGPTETNQVQAAGVELSLSGVPQDLISVVLQSIKRYRPAKIWIGALDQNFAVIADPFLLFFGLTDSAGISKDGKTATIRLGAESRLIALRKPKERRYTDQDQRIERPGDGGFKFVDFLLDAIVTWGST